MAYNQELHFALKKKKKENIRFFSIMLCREAANFIAKFVVKKFVFNPQKFHLNVNNKH